MFELRVTSFSFMNTPLWPLDRIENLVERRLLPVLVSRKHTFPLEKITPMEKNLDQRRPFSINVAVAGNGLMFKSTEGGRR